MTLFVNFSLVPSKCSCWTPLLFPLEASKIQNSWFKSRFSDHLQLHNCRFHFFNGWFGQLQVVFPKVVWFFSSISVILGPRTFIPLPIFCNFFCDFRVLKILQLFHTFYSFILSLNFKYWKQVLMTETQTCNLLINTPIV